MKKNLLLLFSLGLMYSCQKNPDVDKLDNNFVVLTNYDADFNFGNYKSFYIPDSILIIGSNANKSEYWANEKSEEILEAFTDNMVTRGFTQTKIKEDAELGIQLSLIEDTSYFIDYNSNSYWWWQYPYYWSPGYWGGYWGGWYYPYPVSYQYNVGVMIAELVDISNVVEELPVNERKIPIRWTAYMGGLLYNSKFNTAASIESINQAFIQSPYIKTSK